TGLGFSNGALTYGSAIDRTIVYLITVTYQNYKASCSVVVAAPQITAIPLIAQYNTSAGLVIHNRSSLPVPAGYYLVINGAFQSGVEFVGIMTFSRNSTNFNASTFGGYCNSPSYAASFAMTVIFKVALNAGQNIAVGTLAPKPYNEYFFVAEAYK
ncbi:MAG: hypothetical protein LBC33_03430, partial [Mycoplasmataceae bacterium]|nr:hypothetical protein [Mycoplasmataceae bacterium]